MTEKETFLNTWEREFQTTLKVLKAYPPAKLDLKPHERSRSARELAWKNEQPLDKAGLPYQPAPETGCGRTTARRCTALLMHVYAGMMPRR